MSSSSSSNPFGEFMDFNTKARRELPLANEPDILESLNSTLPSQTSTLHPEKRSGMAQIEDFFGPTSANQIRGQDEETKRIRLRVLEQNELTRLKSIVERWETELQHVLSLYQESILRNLLSSTKERIRILEELDLTGTDISLLRELRERVEELNQKGNRAKLLMRQNYEGVEKAIRSPSSMDTVESMGETVRDMGIRGVNTVKQAMQHPMEAVSNARHRAMLAGDRWRNRLSFYQDSLSNITAFFMVLIFGNLTWKDRGFHFLHGLHNLSVFIIDHWRDQLHEMDKEQALQAHREQFERDRLGLLGLMFSYSYSAFMFPIRMISFFWFFGWASWSMTLAKRIIVESYDYLLPIFSSSQPLNDKVLHVYHDAKSNLEDKSTHFSQNVKSSIAKGTHTVMNPLECATEKYVQNDKVKKGLQKAFSTVESLLPQTQQEENVASSEGEHEASLISKKKSSGISSGIDGTSSPIVGKR